MSLRTIILKEWESQFLPEFELTTSTSRDSAKLLKEKGIIEIIELKDGLQISTNSYVGKITIDNLQINVLPKLNGIPLYRLIRYAYGLRDLKLFDSAIHGVSDLSFFDLLIYELYIETEDLIRRGVLRDYIKKEENLSTPRGKVDIVKLSKQSGIIVDKLPCRYFDRNDNTILNQITLAGLKLALELVVDKELRVKLERSYSIFLEKVDMIILNRATLQKAKNSLNRLTERYTPVLEIINILYESRGIQLEDEDTTLNLHGYFFDMNSFFETLIGRLLLNCSDEYSIKDQFSLYDMFSYTPTHNPRGRRSPTPRPDFALMKNGKVAKLLDAKYRDLWGKSLPRDMLYQLSVYAMSGVGDKTATILYPALSDGPIVQKVDINNPVSSEKMASIILQPVNLEKIAMYIDENMDDLESYVLSIIS